MYIATFVVPYINTRKGKHIIYACCINNHIKKPALSVEWKRYKNNNQLCCVRERLEEDKRGRGWLGVYVTYKHTGKSGASLIKVIHIVGIVLLCVLTMR